MKFIPLIITAGIIILAISLFVSATGGDGNGVINFGDGYRTTCDVTIANPILRNSRITNAICTTEKSVLCIGSLNTLAFADQGNMVLTVGSQSALKKWTCGESDYCDTSIAVCSSGDRPTTATLKLRDKANTILSQQEVSIN